MVVIVIHCQDEFVWESGESKTRSRVQLTYASCHPHRPPRERSALSNLATPLFRPTKSPPPFATAGEQGEMSWMSTDMSATTNTDTNGSSSEMNYTSSLQYLNSQLIAHGFAQNPGISLDGLSTSNTEGVVKVLLSLMNQRVVRLFPLFVLPFLANSANVAISLFSLYFLWCCGGRACL